MGLLPILLIAAAMALAVLLWLRPALPVRWALVLFVRMFYRLRVIGAENVPAEGPALLVCNHVSYIDWIFLLVAQRRVIRFVVFAGWTNTLFIRHLLRWGKVIPIDASSGPRAIVKSLRAASEALSRGDVVCIFAEGRFTRTGFLLPFRRGFEEIAKRGNAPIIPVCLDELWGSVFSFYGDRCLWKWPRQLPYSVTVAFGKPMPAESNAEQVRLAVQQLAADAAIARSDDLLPVHRQYVRAAAKRRFGAGAIEHAVGFCKATKMGVAPSSDAENRINKAELLARSICLSWQLRYKVQNPSVVGIWGPSSIDVAVANIALSFCGVASLNLSPDLSLAAAADTLSACGVRHVLFSQRYSAANPIPPVDDVEWIDIDRLGNAAPRHHRTLAKFYSFAMPAFVLERLVLGLHKHQLDDLATVLYSQDSSGSIRGSLISHRALAATVLSLSKTYDLSWRDRIRTDFPLDHCVGLMLSLWMPLCQGMIANFRYSSIPVRTADEIIDARNGHRCFILRHTDGGSQELSAIDSVVFARIQSAIDGSEQRLFAAYFCCELGGIIATNVPDKTLEGFTQIGNKPGTIGQPLAGMAARVVDPQTFELLPAGTNGLLQFRGASLMQGYLGDEEATKQVIRDGWFSTGDMASIDEQGFITIVSPK